MTTTTTTTPTTAPDAAATSTNAAALAHFAAKLAYETDVSDVHAALAEAAAATADDRTVAAPGHLVLVDTRSRQAWEQGHVPGAIHLPTALIGTRAAGLVPAGAAVVTYCWGPGCNGATRAALEFARLGYRVREMIGGFEYWVREGFGYQSARGPQRSAPDPLTAPAGGASCAC
jgi:rhodanese-related sulfurtransferase